MKNLDFYRKQQPAGKKVILKEIQEHNLKKCINWLSDPEVNKYLSHSIKNITEQQELTWFKYIKNSDKDIVFTINSRCLKNSFGKEETYIGNCGIHNIDFEKKSCEFGIFIGKKDCWDKGYGTDTVNTVMDFVLCRLGLNTIRLTVYEYNARAISVYKKCGFVIADVLKRHHFYNDIYWDAYVMEYSKPQ